MAGCRDGTSVRSHSHHLQLDKTLRRWITRNLEGSSQGAEIWTHAFAVDTRRVDINVDFFVPGVPPAAREKVGQAYARAYTTLYDEDVAMMVERQRRIDQRINAGDETVVDVGSEEALVARGLEQRSSNAGGRPLEKR